MTMLRHNLSIDAKDLMLLLQNQRSRYQDKVDMAVSNQDYAEAKDLLNSMEELSKVLETKLIEGSRVYLVLDFTVEEPKSFGVPLGSQI